jgi:hypothetical protein
MLAREGFVGRPHSIKLCLVRCTADRGVDAGSRFLGQTADHGDAAYNLAYRAAKLPM